MSVKINKSPCYGCSLRTELCHESCKKYCEWSKEKDAAKKKLRQELYGISGILLRDRHNFFTVQEKKETKAKSLERNHNGEILREMRKANNTNC